MSGVGVWGWRGLWAVKSLTAHCKGDESRVQSRPLTSVTAGHCRSKDGWERRSAAATIPLKSPDAASHFPFDDMTDITLSSSQRGQDVIGRRASEGDGETGDGVGGRGEAEKAFGNMNL